MLLLVFFDFRFVVQDGSYQLHHWSDKLLLNVNSEGININTDVLEQVDIPHLCILYEHDVQEVLFFLIEGMLWGCEYDRVIDEKLWVVIDVDVLNP